jgi:hypothetical protein
LPARLKRSATAQAMAARLEKTMVLARIAFGNLPKRGTPGGVHACQGREGADSFTEKTDSRRMGTRRIGP